MDTKKACHEPTRLVEFLLRLGQAYLASGEQTAEVERLLRRISSAYGFARSRVIAFPTALFLSVGDGEERRVTIAEGPTESLRLDQIAEVYRLGDLARTTQLEPQLGLRRLTEILRQPPRFGVAGAILGNAILSLGLAMLLMPTLENLAAAVVLGAGVGLLKLISRRWQVSSVSLPVIAATLVSFAVFLAVKWGLPIDPLHTLVAPLVTFLPGARLTLGMVELAYGDMVSGSSRLTAGFVQVLLLVFGLVVGASLVGYRAENLVDAVASQSNEASAIWLAWLGVLVFAFGVFIHFSAPRGSLPWMMVVMLVAFGSQQLALQYFETEVSGLFGMLAVTPLSYWIHLRLKGPPAMVTYLPAFWILVPGALSLLSAKYLLSDVGAGIEAVVSVLIAIVSIAIGTLLGAASYKSLSEYWSRRRSIRISRSLRR